MRLIFAIHFVSAASPRRTSNAPTGEAHGCNPKDARTGHERRTSEREHRPSLCSCPSSFPGPTGNPAQSRYASACLCRRGVSERCTASTDLTRTQRDRVILIALLLAASPHATLTAGPLTLHVVTSQSAQVFHLVDHLSAWTPFAHRQFRDAVQADPSGGLSANDDALLKQHAALRQRLGYGVLDQIFYAPRTLAASLAAANGEGLSAADVATERAVLQAFAARAVAMQTTYGARVDRLSQILVADTATLTAFAGEASHFFGGGRIDLPVFLIASPGAPGTGGGGFNGGRLVVEVADENVAAGVVLHEAWHAFADAHKEELMEAVATVSGLDWETFSEGLAYAVVPGIYRFRSDKDDYLTTKVRDDIAAKNAFSDEPFVRFRRVALALRPTLSDALEHGQTWSSTLPSVLAVVRAVAALAEVEERTPQGFFCFGTAPKPIATAFAEAGHDAWSRAATAEQLAQLAPKIRPQDTVVLVATQHDLRALPPELVALLGGDGSARLKSAQAQARGWLLTSARPRAPRVLVMWGPSPPTELDPAARAALLGAR